MLLKHIHVGHARYISKAKPSCDIDLPENASSPQRYLCTWVIGVIEAVESLEGLHQSEITQVTLLPSELAPSQQTLKHCSDLRLLDNNSQICTLPLVLKLTYLLRPPQLIDLTYLEYYQWQRPAGSHEQKSEDKVAAGEDPTINPIGGDDFVEYQQNIQAGTQAFLQMPI